MSVNSEKQDLALQKVNQGDNLLITGSGGVGKSHLIDQINDEFTVLAAPTGIAALNIGGTTCHRAFGLPLGVPTPTDFLTASRKVKDLFNNYSPVKRFVIDECSMLRTDMFELINDKLQMIRGSKKPFGGLQVVMLGDYFQLDPIITNYESEAFYTDYESPFNFKSKMFDFESIELTEVFRQSDQRQISMLNSIRRKDKYYKFALDTILEESKPYEHNPDTTVICCFKADVRKYNRKFFKNLDSEMFEFDARIDGLDKWKDSTVPHTVQLKEGARVIFKANDVNGEFVNGEKGVVSYVDNICVKVMKQNGVEVLVTPSTWEKYEYKNRGGSLEKEVISTFSQIPLDLAYAQSIHSSQGITLDECAIDVGKGCFSHGQLYVALSRCRDLRNVSFPRKPTYNDVICHKDVKQFYRSMV